MTEIAMQLVESSNLDAIGYDEATKKLLIRFKNGGTYEYKDVPMVEFVGLNECPSVGKYYATNIKKSYESARICQACHTPLDAAEIIERFTHCGGGSCSNDPGTADQA